ncbi:MAG TPA: hypothetical protein VNC13_07470 [Propionibacteriaceae bacterium]|jgi:hypothetical protein|nr:hypothetical protein [Propionibacteriaceae bacterium]
MPGKRVRPAILTVLFASLLVFANSAAASGDEPEKPTCNPVTPFSAFNFSSPTKIDNRWNPLVPGTQFTLNGVADRGGGLLPHEVITTVTDLTKVVNGVRAVVILEKDVNEGELQEAELNFQAQDSAGNMWNLGEYPEEYENGKFHAAPDVWIAGVAEAAPGNSMIGNPQLGTPEYLQGWAPEIEFLDCAKVSEMQQRTCVPAGCYENVMITDERSPLEPESGYQRKYYAPEVGNVQVTAVNDPEGETLVLSKVSQLSPEDMAKARQQALELEKRAYKVSPLYRKSQPVDPPAVVPGPLGG